jgi:hypothetical protein
MTPRLTCNLYRIVVLPAESRPTIRILTSLSLPQMDRLATFGVQQRPHTPRATHDDVTLAELSTVLEFHLDTKATSET